VEQNPRTVDTIKGFVGKVESVSIARSELDHHTCFLGPRSRRLDHRFAEVDADGAEAFDPTSHLNEEFASPRAYVQD